MELREFLQHVVPEGNICIAEHATIEDKKVFIHYAVADHGKAANLATFLDGKGKTIYFALASFKETFQNPNGKVRIKRTQKNVERLKAIWLDIDFKDCPKEELVPKLGTFIKKTGLPKPSMIVNSGGGLHVYWALSSPISPVEWVPLAEGLKKLCKDHNLPADHVCTSDQARVLRPITTHNRKYGEDCVVRLVAGTGTEYDYSELQESLPAVDLGQLPAHLRGVSAATSEYSATNTRRSVDTKAVIQNCAVLKHVLRTGGSEQSEPEWNATLLVLKYLDEGAKLVHPFSKGHIDYSPAATDEKWQQKLEADTSGPTHCSTLEQYGHTGRCQTCPIYKSKKHKTPLALGYVNDEPEVPKEGTPVPNKGKFVSVNTPTHDYPNGWRDVHGNEGTERKLLQEGEWVWERVLHRTWRLKEAQRNFTTGLSAIRVEAAQKSGKRINIDVPGAYLSGCPELWKLLGENGAPLLASEKNHWTHLMATWLSKLQEENAELATVDRFGWVRDDDTTDPVIRGFSAGDHTYMEDGKDIASVRVQREHEQIGKLYKPVGKLEKWREAASYITEQNNPAFTAILASAFAAPLITFADLPGAVLTIVSTESGIGKTSALRTAQAVWGSPQKAMNSTHDTPLSITKKIGFLNNLPAYWDEIRGQQALDGFYNVAFDVAQGKDKTRLTQNAEYRHVNDWQTMVIAASNDSLFDYMALKGGHSNASIARTFEIVVDSGMITPDLNAHPLFGSLDLNYGHAGQVYSKHLARNHNKIAERVRKMLAKTREWAAGGGERFWCAIIACLIVAASEANRCGITDIDINTLAAFLRDNLTRLRRRTGTAMSTTSPRELVGDYTQHFQNGEMILDKFPERRGRGYTPQILKPPKSGLMYVRAGNVYRFRKNDFSIWLRSSRNLQFSSLEAEMIKQLNMTESNTSLGLGTNYALPRTIVLEVFMDPDDMGVVDE